MTLSRGRDILAIPGPSIIPDRVLRAMHRPAPNIYEGELVAITETSTDIESETASSRHCGRSQSRQSRRNGDRDGEAASGIAAD